MVAQDYSLLVAFLIKESFFVTYAFVWLLLRLVIPLALLPLLVLVKVASTASSAYQQQKVRATAAAALLVWPALVLQIQCGFRS